MKKYLLGVAALCAVATFTSCEQDAPEINFSHSTTIVSDFSGVIKAINDMSLSLSEKLEIINNAIKDQTLTLSQKMDILNAAIEKGILTYQQMTQKTIDAINAMNGSLTDKLAAIQTALTEMNTSLTMKLALIEATMKAGLADIAAAEELIRQAIASLEGTMEQKLAAIETAVNNMNVSLTAKLALIEAAIDSGFADVAAAEELIRQAIVSLEGTTAQKLAAIETAIKDGNAELATKLALIEATMNTGLADIAAAEALIQQAIASLEGSMEQKLAAIETAMLNTNTTLSTKLAAIEAAINAGVVSAANQETLTRTALIASLNQGFADTAAGLAAVNTALGRLSIKDGVYAADKNGMTISPSAWEALKEDPEMYNAFLNTLEVVTPTVTTSQQSGHSCQIPINLVTYEQIELLSQQTVFDDSGVNKPAYKIVRMYSKATYNINKGGCSLGCHEINITDVRGTGLPQYNFNGGSGGNVELIFWDGADKFVLAGHVEVIMR